MRQETTSGNIAKFLKASLFKSLIRSTLDQVQILGLATINCPLTKPSLLKKKWLNLQAKGFLSSLESTTGKLRTPRSYLVFNLYSQMAWSHPSSSRFPKMSSQNKLKACTFIQATQSGQSV